MSNKNSKLSEAMQNALHQIFYAPFKICCNCYHLTRTWEALERRGLVKYIGRHPWKNEPMWGITGEGVKVATALRKRSLAQRGLA
jgi:hypothetical protein